MRILTPSILENIGILDRPSMKSLSVAGFLALQHPSPEQLLLGLMLTPIGSTVTITCGTKDLKNPTKSFWALWPQFWQNPQIR